MVEWTKDGPWHSRTYLWTKSLISRHPKAPVSCVSPCKDLIVCKHQKQMIQSWALAFGKTSNCRKHWHEMRKIHRVLLQMHHRECMFSPSVAAMVKPSPHDTLFNIFPPKGPTRTWTPWCFLKFFTPSCPYLLQPKVIRRPRSVKSEETFFLLICDDFIAYRKNISLLFAVPSMAAVWVFPGAMTWILNRDSCFAKVSVVMYGIPW